MSIAPRWTRVVVGLLGLVTLVLATGCFVAPELLFGVDAFRTLTRVPIGLLGAGAVGVGVSALLAARSGELARLWATALPMLLASPLVPPVIGFNIGAFDQTGTSGFRTVTLVVAFSLLYASPLLAAMLVLRRIRMHPVEAITTREER
jgi:hypothetical protein